MQNAYVTPSSQIEKEIAAIWQQLLGIAEVGVYDNFFELGGHSLLATQVVSRMSEAFQVRASLQDFFRAPTVAELAQMIADMAQKHLASLDYTIVPEAFEEGRL